MNQLNDLIIELSATRSGASIAFFLALVSAVSHATLGAIGKTGPDPFITRGAINITYSIIALPFVLFVFPLPSTQMVPVIIFAYFAHLIYEWFQARAFSIGAFTLVYPLARGIGPLTIAIASIFVFSESLELSQWLGLLILSFGLFLFALVNYLGARRAQDPVLLIGPAIRVSVMCGIMIAAYTVIDAYGMRLSNEPLTFLFWVFFVGGFGFPVVAWYHWKNLDIKPNFAGLWPRAVAGAIAAYMSFGALMIATRLGKVSETAAIRETSVVFAIIIGMVFFRERLTRTAVILVFLIATGAILVKSN